MVIHTDIFGVSNVLLMYRKKAQRDEIDESVQDEGERDILELTK